MVQLKAATDDLLQFSKIDNLLNAMVAFNSPITGELTRRSADYAGLETVIAVSWDSILPDDSLFKCFAVVP